MFNMKSKWTFSVTVMLVMIFMLGACGNSDSDATSQEADGDTGDISTDLTFATYISESHYMGEIDQRMIERVEEQTDGQVQINAFYDGTLIDPKDWYQELLQGSADMTQGNIGSERDRFELQYATGMFNYGITDLNTLLEFSRKLEEEVPELAAEYEEVVPISRLTAGQAWIHTNDKPIRSSEDIKGLNLKVADDASVALAKALGANPMRIPISETYTALEKGTIDGVITGGDPLKTFNFAEVTNYSTKLPYATPWIYSKFVNKDVYDNLPSEVQNILQENGKWWEEELITGLEEEVNAGVEMAKEHGNEIIELSPEETDKILSVMEENALELAEELDSKGKNGTELFEASRKLAEQLTE